MGRIHDALKKAEAERSGSEEEPKVAVGVGFQTLQMPGGVARVPAVDPTESIEAFVPEPMGSEIDLQPVPNSRLYAQRQDGALGVHQLRMLQVSLLEMQSRQPFKRLLITSATSGEGKTEVAANLAWTLASDGDRKVLLIDADIQNASLHSVCGIPNEYGLKDLWLDGDSASKAIRKVKSTNLYLMTAGVAANDSIRSSYLLRLQKVLEQLAPAYDFILLDSAPLMAGVDAKLLCSVADAVLLVVRAGMTRRQVVKQALERLENQNILGVVLNELDPRQPCFASYYNHDAGLQTGSAANGTAIRPEHG